MELRIHRTTSWLNRVTGKVLTLHLKYMVAGSVAVGPKEKVGGAWVTMAGMKTLLVSWSDGWHAMRSI